MSGITWFKVLTDIFSDDKIKILQSMPEGDSLLVMWFKVLAQAGRTNDGGYIYLKKDIPYTPGMLATLFNKPQQLVELALRTFEQFDMIDIDEKGYIFVTNWEKHQSTEAIEAYRERERLRKAQYRQKKKIELLSGTSPGQLPENPRLDIDIDKEKKYIPYREIVAFLNDLAEKKYKTTKKTIALISARWNEGFQTNDFQDVIRKKVSEWKGTEMEKYIRPETLFGTKFESYLNQPIKVTPINRKANEREKALQDWMNAGGNPSEFRFDASNS